MNKSHITAAALLVIVVALGLVGNSDIEAAQNSRSEYCDMVKLHKETNGQFGWPAYKGTEQCR